MTRLFVILIAPLLVSTLMSFTPDFTQKEVYGKDSSTVTVMFDPAQIIVNDNRTTDIISSVIKENAETNLKFANAIESVSDAIKSNLSLQERRCVSIMDRITQQTGLSSLEINKIIHKKRVYDMIFYTLFTMYILFVMFGLSSMTHHAKAISTKEWYIKTITAVMVLTLFWLAYKSMGMILTSPNYNIIQTIINSPPG